MEKIFGKKLECDCVVPVPKKITESTVIISGDFKDARDANIFPWECEDCGEIIEDMGVWKDAEFLEPENENCST